MPTQYCPENQTTAPINISNNTKECQSICNFIPKYSQTGIKCTNHATYIGVTLDIPQNDIIFNEQKYQVTEIRIFNKPLHTYFNDSKSNIGEILIIHSTTAITSNPTLLVISIPIIQSSTPNLASLDLETIIKQTAAHANLSTISDTNSSGSDLQSPSFGITTINFTLNNFVPKTPFYFYNGIFSFQQTLSSCSAESNIIVFPLSSGVTIDASTNAIFQSSSLLVPPTKFPINPNPSPLYYNSKGAGQVTDDQIYIDCQPVNQETEEVYVPFISTNAQNINKLIDEFVTFGESPITNAMMGILVGISIYFAAEKIMELMGPSKR